MPLTAMCSLQIFAHIDLVQRVVPLEVPELLMSWADLA
jgi:hypothetical protein